MIVEIRLLGSRPTLQPKRIIKLINEILKILYWFNKVYLLLYKANYDEFQQRIENK